jgi:VanZ family protein
VTRFLIRTITAIYWLGLFTVTHLPPTRMPRTRVWDKLEHFVAYAILAGLLFVAIGRRRVWLVLAICLVYGAFDELTQLLPFVRRQCSLVDWIADALGAIFALAACNLIATRRARR